MRHPQHPVSPGQLAANRANAARSTGPRTPQGKTRSAQNARKHGFTASTFAVVRLEDLHEVAHLKDDLLAVYQPVNSQELFALERIALGLRASPNRLSSAPRALRPVSSPPASTSLSTPPETPWS